MVLVAAAASGHVAFGQSISPLEPPDTSRYLRWGPFRVRPGFNIPALGYDSNVFYRPDDDPDLPQVGDYFVALAPRIEGLVLFGHSAFLTFDERIEYYAYAGNQDLNYFNQFGKARATVPFRRFGFYGDVGLYRTRDRPLEAQDARPIRRDVPVGAGVILKLGWRTDAELGLVRDRLTATDENDATIGPNSDRVETGTRLRARYLLVGRTRLLLDSSRRTIRFDNAETAGRRDGDERRALLGVDFGLGGTISGTLRAGYSNFDLVDPAATGFSGLVADAAMAYNFGGGGSRIILTAARDTKYSLYDETNLYILTSGELTVIKYFNRFIGAELGTSRSVLEFLGDPQDRIDHYQTVSAGVRFRFSETDLGRKVEYSFRYVHSQTDSSPGTARDQSRGTIGFGVSYGY
jgi:hypothetical protein